MNRKRSKCIILMLIIIVAITACIIACSRGDDSIGNQIILSQTGEDTVAVSWTSDTEYDGIAVISGDEVKAECTEIRDGEYYRYTTEFKGLEKDKTYKYRIGSTDTLSKKRMMKLADDESEFSFLYIGDIQYQLRDRDYEIWGDFMQTAYEDNEDAAFGIFAGDMVDKAPDMKDWTAFFTNAEPVFSEIPMMTTAGNHETSITPSVYLDMVAMPENSPAGEEAYSFDYGDAHFVSLNSNLLQDARKDTDGYQQLMTDVNEWLQQDLSGTDCKWKIVYMHHPMYPVDEDNGIYSELRQEWEQILTDNDVDLVLCGHQHVYMRTKPLNGITYVMANSGEKRSYYVDEGTVLPEYVETMYEDGSNYVRIDVNENSLLINAYDEAGNKIDQCEIN